VPAALSTLAFNAAAHYDRNNVEACFATCPLICLNRDFKIDSLNLTDAVLHKIQRSLQTAGHYAALWGRFLSIFYSPNYIFECL